MQNRKHLPAIRAFTGLSKRRHILLKDIYTIGLQKQIIFHKAVDFYKIPSPYNRIMKLLQYRTRNQAGRKVNNNQTRQQCCHSSFEVHSIRHT